jgi:hypothetical protein
VIVALAALDELHPLFQQDFFTHMGFHDIKQTAGLFAKSMEDRVPEISPGLEEVVDQH